MDFAADTPLMYSDFGVLVTLTPKGGGASTSALALHRRPGTTVIGGDLLVTEHTLRYPLASFPNVKRGDTFAIGSETFKVRENPQVTAAGLEALAPLESA